MTTDDARRVLAARLAEQAGWCRRLGSPLYAGLLDAAAADCAAGGATWAVLAGHEEDAPGSALVLRFLGAVHRVVLRGEAPALARHYPSAGGASDGDAWPDFAAVVADHRDRVRALLAQPVQTNEVGRSAALLGGFLSVARATDLPLRLLEVGASAGLNLRWDHYRYESHGVAFGDPASPVRFVDPFEGTGPGLDGTVAIAERRGCDAAPLDPAAAETRLTLRSYLWPDQRERLARLDGALAVAGRVPVAVDRADAPAWLAAQLARPARGAATVVFHSIVMQYLGREGVERFRAVLHAAGDAASVAAPLAWLSLEPARAADGDLEYRVTLTSWPGGTSRTLAIASPHGPPVRWLA